MDIFICNLEYHGVGCFSLKKKKPISPPSLSFLKYPQSWQRFPNPHILWRILWCDITHTKKYTHNTPRNQLTDTEIYINTTYFVFTPAICIKLNEVLTDIKNLVYRGRQYIYFSFFLTATWLPQGHLWAILKGAASLTSAIYLLLIFFNCYLVAPRPSLGHSEGSSLTNLMLT